MQKIKFAFLSWKTYVGRSGRMWEERSQTIYPPKTSKL